MISSNTTLPRSTAGSTTTRYYHMAGIAILALIDGSRRASSRLLLYPRNGEIRHRHLRLLHSRLSALQCFIRKHGSMMRLRGTLGRRRPKHMQFSSHMRKGASSLAPQVCNVIQVSHHVPLPAPLAVEFGDCWHVQVLVHICQGLARQPGKASMYPTRAAILLVSFSGRANSGLCPATLDIRLRCGRTTPYSVQAVKTCMSHAARRFATVYNAGRHRNPASRERRARFTSTTYEYCYH